MNHVYVNRVIFVLISTEKGGRVFPCKSAMTGFKGEKVVKPDSYVH